MGIFWKPKLQRTGKSRRNKVLDTDDQPKLNQEGINNLNRYIKNNEIETVIKNLPTKKSSDVDEIITEFFQTFKKELIQILQTIQKIQRKGY
jgi:hypothetical protein